MASRSRGYTLLEILLTLAVLVVIAGLVMPTLIKPFAVERLKKAADLVQSEWTRARVAAMSSGLTHVFVAEPESGTYQMQTWAGGDAGIESSGPSAADQSTAAPLPGSDAPSTTVPGGVATGQKQLPDDIVFVSAQSTLDARASQAAAEAGQAVSPTTLPPVFFYPDGTASDAALVLRNENGVCVQIELRGLTGIATVGETYQSEVRP